MLVTSNKLKLSIAGGSLAIGLIAVVGLNHMDTKNNASIATGSTVTAESSVAPAEALDATPNPTPSPSDAATPDPTPTPSSDPTPSPTPTATSTPAPTPSATPPIPVIHTTDSQGHSIIITHN